MRENPPPLGGILELYFFNHAQSAHLIEFFLNVYCDTTLAWEQLILICAL